MFNVGIGEIAVIAVLGLLVFGPDRLPRAVKSISTMLRSLRSSATEATRTLQDAAGWDGQQTRQAIDDIAQLHPKRILGSILDDAAEPGGSAPGRRNGAQQAAASGRLGDFDPDAP